MKTTTKQVAFGLCLFVLTSGAGVTLNSCSRARSEPASILIDGSSTVFPITQAVAKEFQNTQTEDVAINVDFTGTGGGLRKFCAGETDISNASRPIQPKEMDACRNAGVPYIELPIAFDALTFDGKAQFNLTLGELLRKQEKF